MSIPLYNYGKAKGVLVGNVCIYLRAELVRPLDKYVRKNNTSVGLISNKLIKQLLIKEGLINDNNN